MKKVFFVFVIGLILLLYSLGGCATDSPTTVYLSPSITPSGTPTRKVASTSIQNSITTLNLSVLSGTPVPIPNEPITSENVNQIQELAIWGKGRISRVAFSPDGEILAVGTAAGIWLYDVETLELLRFIRTDRVVDRFFFSENGQILTASLGATMLITWDITTGEVLNNQLVGSGFHGLANPNIVFSANGSSLAEMIDEQRVGVWQVTNGNHLQNIQGDNLFVIRGIALSPGGNQIVTSSDNGLTKFWDVNTGNLQQIFNTGKRPVLFSSDGKLLAAGLQLWNIETGGLQCVMEENEDWGISSLAFSDDGNLLASGKPDGTVEIWELDTCQRSQYMIGHWDDIISLAFSPDGKWLVSGSWDGTIRLWDVYTGEIQHSLEGHWPQINDLALTPMGDLFVTPGFDTYIKSRNYDREIQVWDIKSGQVQYKFVNSHKNGDVSLALSKDGKVLATGAQLETYIQIWNAETYQPVNKIDLSSYVQEIALSSDGGNLAHTISEASWVNIYEVQTGEKLEKIIELKGAGGSLAFTPSSENLILASDLVFIHDLEMVKQKPDILEDSKWFSGDPAFSPDERTVAIDSFRRGEIKIWQLETGEASLALSHPPQKTGRIIFSLDGTLLIGGFIGGQRQIEKSIFIWNADNGDLLYTIPNYTGGINQLVISPDGNLLISGSIDGTVRIWGIPPE